MQLIFLSSEFDIVLVQIERAEDLDRNGSSLVLARSFPAALRAQIDPNNLSGLYMAAVSCVTI